MTEITPLFSETLILALLMMVGMWLVSLPLKNASIVDPFWGLGFVIVAVWAAWPLSTIGFNRQGVVLLLTVIWGMRLSGYLFYRNLGKGEDFRYQGFRKHYGEHRYWWISLFQVFLLQGFILWLVVSPVLVQSAVNQEISFGLADYAAFALWLTGFVFEAVGDWQMMRFRAKPENRGLVMDRGMWKYTRHPNYFGESLIWWGLWLFAAAAGYWWTIYSPVLITVLLLRVSGVSMLERSLKHTKPAYQAYMERTPAFFPWKIFKKGKA